MLDKRTKWMMHDILASMAMIILWRAGILPFWVVTFALGSFITAFLFTYLGKIHFKEK